MASRCVGVDPTEEQLCNTEQEQQLGALVWCSLVLVLVLGWLGKIRIDPRSSSSQGEAAAAAQTIALSTLRSTDRVLLPLQSRPRPHVTGGHTMEQ